jgi:quercetin dioxygenase-like cupin family protein
VVYAAPDEKHWHGADPDNFMIHLAISPGGATDGRTEWMEEVADEEYSGGRV